MTRRVSMDRVVAKFLLCFVMVFSLFCMSSTQVFASRTTSTEQSYNKLTSSVASDLGNNEYKLEGGGTTTGSEVLQQVDTGFYDVDETTFNSLTSKSQSQFVNDLAASSQSHIGENGISEDTVQNWWKNLQSKNGVGSKFLNVALQNTKPDFVSANNIFKPFSGPISTALGLGSILILAFLGLSMVMDIAYIVIPPFRMLAGSEEGGDGKKWIRSNLISHNAIYAVKKVESDSDSSGTPKQALGIFLKRSSINMVILGICLLYLVNGQLYTGIGMLLDLVSGFLGF